MAPLDGPEGAAIGTGIGVIALNPVFATGEPASVDNLARQGDDPLDDPLLRAARIPYEHDVSRLRAIPGEGEAIEEDALTRQERRRHAAAADANAPGEAKGDERVEAGNGRNEAEETAAGLSGHIRL